MSTSTNPFSILMPTDVFPPICGGAGWSAHALALALIAQGHSVQALVPQRQEPGLEKCDILGVPSLIRGYQAPNIPFVLNYFRHERLWPVLANDLVHMARAQSAKADPLPGILHAQHVQAAPAAIIAGKRLNMPVVVTVRDHWPWDYFATGLHADRLPYPNQNWMSLAADLPVRLGPLRGSAALLAIPYMLAHLHRRQSFLMHADAVIAVSDYIAKRLRAFIDPERVHVIHNLVDTEAIQRTLATPAQTPEAQQDYMLFVGKLERNKGAHLLPEIMRELAELALGGAQALPTLLIAGNGPLQSQIEAELAAQGVRVRVLDWVDHEEVLRLMAHTKVLLYPSLWGEPLSRVPIEAMACGAVVVAMPTGGTPEIIMDGKSGFLEASAAGMARRVAMLLADSELRMRISTAATRRAREIFGIQRIVSRVERLYQRVKEEEVRG